MEANGKLQRSNNKCLWPECLVEAAARDFKHFKLRVLEILMLANGRLERPNNRGLWRQAARGILSILSVLGVLRLANGRLERPNNRELWRQTAGCNALTTEGYGGKRQADRSEGFEAF